MRGQGRFGGGSDGGPGFTAVRSRYGEDMVQRIRNWVEIARVYLLAQGMAVTDPEFEREIRLVKANIERARVDPDYALDQAEKVARTMPKGRWPVVPTVSQLRRDLGLSPTYVTEWEAEHRQRIIRWREEQLDAFIGRKRPASEDPVPVDPEQVEAKREQARQLARREQP